MTISKRVLTKWRKDALCDKELLSKLLPGSVSIEGKVLIESNDRILALTQELIDQELLKETDREAMKRDMHAINYGKPFHVAVFNETKPFKETNDGK